MINTKTHQIQQDFLEEINGKCLCELKKIRFDQAIGPDYSRRDVQQLYLLSKHPVNPVLNPLLE